MWRRRQWVDIKTSKRVAVRQGVIWRLLRVTSVLMVVMIAGVGGLTYTMRSMHEVYSCYHVVAQDSQEIYSLIVDSTRGASFQRSLHQLGFVPTLLVPSPDGRSALFEEGERNLYISRYTSPGRLDFGPPILIASNPPLSSSKWDYVDGWSPDSQFFAFLSPSRGLASTPSGAITVVNAEAPETRYEFPNTKDFTLVQSWSADGQYLAFTEDSTLMFWSRATHQFENLPEGVPPYSLKKQQDMKSGGIPYLYWSPEGHRIAYLSEDNKGTHVVIYSPGEGQHQAQAFDLAGDVYSPWFSWSPSGKYLTLSIQHWFGAADLSGVRAYWQTHIFGIDGSSFAIIPSHALPAVLIDNLGIDALGMVEEDFPYPVSWSANDESLVYMDQVTSDESRLMKFDIHMHRTVILMQHVLNYSFVWAVGDKLYGWFHWRRDGQTVEGPVDLETGTQTETQANIDPSWDISVSPDGRVVAFFAWQNTQYSSGTLRFGSLTGTELRFLSPSLTFETAGYTPQFDWSPDDKSVAVIARGPNSSVELYIFYSNGALLNHYSLPGYLFDASWTQCT